MGATTGRGVGLDTGKSVGTVDVQIGPAFLHLFSEQMYSSPNKAFEELISNSWDAGASAVHVYVAEDLAADDACAWVLDNGESMDLDGLHRLWTVASSDKPTLNTTRPQIGKFGIGKLATYVLAHQLTYICKHASGSLLIVSMDYRRIGESGEGLHIDRLPLDVRSVERSELKSVLSPLPGSGELLALLANDVPAPKHQDSLLEYGGPDPPASETAETWTLALLTDLRDAGRSMQTGHLRRMLRAALPLGSSVAISFNGDLVPPSKSDIPISEDWILGPELDLAEVSLADSKHKITASDDPYPHITIQGVPGKLTGSVKLYADRISGGKSVDLGVSNGFFINILGRVINADDPYFGLDNLNHSAWARFRATVRADGLNDSLAVNREALRDTDAVVLVRALLMSLFNRARVVVDSAKRASWPDAGDVLRDAWGEMPLQPLRKVVAEDEFEEVSELLSVIDTEGVDDLRLAQETVVAADTPIAAVVFEERLPTDVLVRYELGTRRIVVNEAHPFALEHGGTHEQQLLLRDAAVTSLLTDLYLAELGVPGDTLEEAGAYRDQMFRLLARLKRKSAVTLVELLELVTSQAKPLETVVGDALESLGFVVRRMGGTGEPEGVATAPLSRRSPRKAALYSFTYDAKSSTHEKVKNNDVKVSTLLRHRENESADYTLVVARDFESGALEVECKKHLVTPMRASDLGRLVMLNATHGPLNLDSLRQLFHRYSPEDVQNFIDELASQRDSRLSYDEFFEALDRIGYEEPDILTASVIARVMREERNDDEFPSRDEVGKLVGGLSVLVPQLIRSSGERIFIGAHSGTLRDAVVQTLKDVPEAYRQGIGLAEH